MQEIVSDAESDVDMHTAVMRMLWMRRNKMHTKRKIKQTMRKL